MFTRCPECRTVFHVSAAELRAAAGTVICGACGATFDALDSLSETRPGEGETPAEDEGAAEPEPGAEDEGAAEPDPGPEDDGEPLRDEDAFLEELESLIGAESEDEDEFGMSGAAELPRDEEPFYGEEELPEDDFPDPDAVFRVDDFGDEADSDQDGPFVGDDETPGENGPDDDAWRTPGAAASLARDGDEETGAGSAEDEDGEEQARAGDTLPEFAREPSEEARGRRPWLAILLVLVAVLLLAGTWAHSQRGKLMRHPTGEAVLGPVYSLLGMDVAPEWDPAEFRALKWEAVADPEQPDRLIVAVEFVNDADYAQPYPIIRVALQDRFGRPAGRHDFAPGDYLESYSRGGRLPAAGRLQTTVEVPDPEGRAEGFRIDFCLQTRARGLVCGPELFR